MNPRSVHAMYTRPVVVDRHRRIGVGAEAEADGALIEL